MASMAGRLDTIFRAALRRAFGEEEGQVDPLLRPAGDERFGDYQSNVAMSLAKTLGRPPREVAERLVAAIRQAERAPAVFESLEVAGPGFINIRLKAELLDQMLDAIPPVTEPAADRLGVEPVAEPQTVVVDYSSPNIAKQMHVGHLRSTIIGDTIARILEFDGHNVIRQNHVGDWGTQFGMLCAHLKEKLPDAIDRPGEVHLADLEDFYRQASARDKEDPAFHERARAEVVALHRGEESTMRAWRYIVEESRRHYERVYERLGVSLTREHERGESFYADRLERVVQDLQEQFGPGAAAGAPPASGVPGITVEESDGALCIFHRTLDGEPLFKNPDGKPIPMIIRKSDGAYLYATTDLAALDLRLRELQADRVIYVTDARQTLHFQMLFAAARAAGWTVDDDRIAEARLEHVTFGSILGEDRRPLKSRTGENVKLSELLDEAVNRAEALILANEADPDKRRGFTEAEIRDIAEAVGIGAVKYADLSQNRQGDYVFSWDRMLAMEGNTAPYLMYAYARIRSIHRKGAQDKPSADTAAGVAQPPPAGQAHLQTPVPQGIHLIEPAERALGRQILRFEETLEAVTGGLRINLLTDYLYQLAGLFMKFYETCPVLSADNPAVRASRLELCDLAARTLKCGLDLLGIRVVERM
jgi:arginyl-tRNA synthetase